MKEPETGDIFLNPETLNLYTVYRSNFNGNWYLRLVHETYQINFERGANFIFIGNIYDLTKERCEEEVRQIMLEHERTKWSIKI